MSNVAYNKHGPVVRIATGIRSLRRNFGEYLVSILPKDLKNQYMARN